MLARLFLELGHPVEPAEPGDAVEHPGQTRVIRVLALIEQDILFRVDAGGDIGGGHDARALAQIVGVLPLRDGVHVDHAIDALILALQVRPVADRAEIIAEMEVAGGLDARKDAVHGPSLWTRG